MSDQGAGFPILWDHGLGSVVFAVAQMALNVPLFSTRCRPRLKLTHEKPMARTAFGSLAGMAGQRPLRVRQGQSAQQQC